MKKGTDHEGLPDAVPAAFGTTSLNLLGTSIQGETITRRKISSGWAPLHNQHFLLTILKGGRSSRPGAPQENGGQGTGKVRL